MPHEIIALEPVGYFEIPAGSTIEMDESAAADVSPYRLIIPFVKVQTPILQGGNSIVVVTFRTAAYLAFPRESQMSGPRFVDIATIGITGAGTFSVSSPFQNPGGLIVWKMQNMATDNPARFIGDIHLVCHG